MRTIFKTVVVFGVIVLSAYFGGSIVLANVSRKALPRLQQVLRSQGVVIADLDFADARILSYRGASWSDITAVASRPTGQPFRVWIREIAFEVEDLSLKRHKLVVSGLTARPEGAMSSEYDRAGLRFKEAAIRGRVDVALASFGFEMSLLDPAPGLEAAATELGRIAREGITSLPLELYAEVRSLLDGQELGVRLRAVDREGVTALQVDQDDLRRQAKHFTRPLTDLEIGLIGEYPLRAPDLLLIKKYAEQTAMRARQRDKTVPEDAYRHVLWSYLLTEEFGAGFAEQVTDAHEIGSTTNTEAEHRMDYNNNEVGRQYAAQGVNEFEILPRLRRDRAVIKAPV